MNIDDRDAKFFEDPRYEILEKEKNLVIWRYYWNSWESTNSSICLIQIRYITRCRVDVDNFSWWLVELGRMVNEIACLKVTRGRVLWNIDISKTWERNISLEIRIWRCQNRFTRSIKERWFSSDHPRKRYGRTGWSRFVETRWAFCIIFYDNVVKIQISLSTIWSFMKSEIWV